MNLILIVNPELGWDSVVAAFDASGVTQEQIQKLEEICHENSSYILIDWHSLGSVESFIRENE